MMRRGRPIKYPRPTDCPHLDRPEHANGVCYQCSSNINNQKKREKKLANGHDIPKRRKRRINGEMVLDYNDFIELNIGGKVFGTTLNTLTREMNLLSLLVGSQANFRKYDSHQRLFIDRDPTHFRWILNYLRDGFLVTVPSQLQDRLELLKEASFYRVDSLTTIISNPYQHLQAHPHIRAQHVQAQQLQQLQYQALQAQMGMMPELEKPSFLTARPSTMGIFYLSDHKWSEIFSEKSWNIIGARFEDNTDEITMLSLTVDYQQDASGQVMAGLSDQQELCRSKLSISEIAKANIDLTHLLTEPQSHQARLAATVEFWWEPSQSQYPQLFCRVSRGTDDMDMVAPQGAMDFIKTQ